MLKDEGDVAYCLKTMCPNHSTHRSGYCVACRTFHCPSCKKEHTIAQAPHSIKLRYCAQCRRSPKKQGLS